MRIRPYLVSKLLSYFNCQLAFFKYIVVMEPVELIIDTDPGIDDALAILLALGHFRVKVAAITTGDSAFRKCMCCAFLFLFSAVHGNGNVRLCSLNARKLVVLAGCPDVPVYEGAARSIKDMSSDTPCVGTSIVHGKNGFGEVEPPVDVSGWSPPTESAAQALCIMATERPGKVSCLIQCAPSFLYTMCS